MSSIETLPTTTFSGRRFTRNQLGRVQETVAMCGKLSRKELAQTICEHLNWKNARGGNKIDCCLGLLESMEAHGLVKLPEKRLADVAPKHSVEIHLAEQGSAVETDLKEVLPIVLQRIITAEQRAKFKASIQAHHYLGYKHPVGSQMGYFIVSQSQSRILGCLLYSSSARWNLPARDNWIGWSSSQRAKLRHLVLTQERFLIFPWVKVPHLASHVLSLSEKQLSRDWLETYRYSPVLIETFVDSSRFSGTCYLAANWECIGETKANSSDDSKPPTAKEIFVRPLCRDVRQALTKGTQQRALKQRYRNDVKASGTRVVDDAFVALWRKVLHLLHEVAAAYDEEWRVRNRVIDTLLLILLIFRLVSSKNKQSYGTTIDELWDSCRELDLPLPQKASIAPSSLCTARKKLHESVFQCVNRKILDTYAQQDADRFLWMGHRVFAVDGSKINLPRPLQRVGYTLPNADSYYPQGLLSCLYELKSQLPVDFDLVSHGDERLCAEHHLQALKAGDVVVYDRGYFSYVLLDHHVQADLHAVFRLQESSSSVISHFWLSPEIEQVVTLYPSQRTLTNIAKLHPEVQIVPRTIRLVKYQVEGTLFCLATTLIDSEKFPLDALRDLYHARWGIEELYKVSKRLFVIEDFHSKYERGVKQELFAHFTLITINRLFANQADRELNADDTSSLIQPVIAHATASARHRVKTNFKNCIHVIARRLEPLFLLPRKLFHVVKTAYDCIIKHHQRVRPGRSYPRKSMRPETKWRPSTKKRTQKLTAPAAPSPA